jgi:hypothetical protein
MAHLIGFFVLGLVFLVIERRRSARQQAVQRPCPRQAAPRRPRGHQPRRDAGRGLGRRRRHRARDRHVVRPQRALSRCSTAASGASGKGSPGSSSPMLRYSSSIPGWQSRPTSTPWRSSRPPWASSTSGPESPSGAPRGYHRRRRPVDVVAWPAADPAHRRPRASAPAVAGRRAATTTCDTAPPRPAGPAPGLWPRPAARWLAGWP